MMGRRRMKNYNPMAIAESPMTAPDSRDIVERVVAEIERVAHTLPLDRMTPLLKKWADRLQALARGPQQAGGEDVLQAEVARRTDSVIVVGATSLACSSAVKEMFDLMSQRAEAAEAALREAGRDAERLDWLDQQRQHYHGLRMVSWGVTADSAIGIRAAIDAALNGGQQD